MHAHSHVRLHDSGGHARHAEDSELGAFVLADAAMRVAERILALPAVATLDWCERAAAGLATVVTPSVAAVVIGGCRADGTIRDVEAVGIARCDEGPAPTRGALALSDVLPAPDPDLAELRCRLETLSTLGFRVGEGGLPPRYRGCASWALGSGWKRGDLGAALMPLNSADAVIAVAGMPDTEPGRSVIALVVPACWSQPPKHAAPLVEIVGAATELLAARARRAIGPERAGRSGWISMREQQVLERLVLGMSVRQIAAELGRSQHTVHDHVKALHRKLKASSRGELIARTLGYLGECPRIRTARHAGTQVLIDTKPKTPDVRPIDL